MDYWITLEGGGGNQVFNSYLQNFEISLLFQKDLRYPGW